MGFDGVWGARADGDVILSDGEWIGLPFPLPCPFAGLPFVLCFSSRVARFGVGEVGLGGGGGGGGSNSGSSSDSSGSKSGIIAIVGLFLPGGK